jgi:hypothetical protein
VEDLAGTSVKEVLAVTTDGYAAHFDGASWRVFDLPTNGGLNSVCMLDDGLFAICGYNSTILIGRRDHWQLVAPIDQARNYYGVAKWGKDIFFAHLGGIDVFDGLTLRPYDIPQIPKSEFTVLRSGPDGVWSFADHTVGVITAAGWRRV